MGLARCITSAFFLLVSATAFADDAEAILILLENMEEALIDVADYTKVVEKTERQVDGSEIQETVFVKFRRPDQVYLKVLEGEKQGSEIIYPKSADEPVVLAHVGGFAGGVSSFLKNTVVLRGLVPTEFSLDDPRIVNGQHQTVADSNFNSTIERIASNVRTAAALGEGSFALVQDCSDDGQCLHRMDIELPADAGEMHRASEDDSLWTIALQHGRPMFIIWYNNPGMQDPSDLRAGQLVFVPRYYAPKGRIWVSPENNLLSKIEIFDAEGRLFERYVYRDVSIDPGLTDLDFDPDNPEYQF